MIQKKLLMIATLALTLTACSNDSKQETESQEPSSNERKDIQLSVEQQQLVTNSNDFAFQLFRQLGAGDEVPQSRIVSPLSITFALGMMNNGANGETQQQINQVLGFGDTGADGINAFCQKMLTEAPTLDIQTKVTLANTIFVNYPYQLLTAFTDKVSQYYGAEPQTRDFADGKTLDAINQWASDHTEKMIETVLSSDEFNPEAVSYLLNAIYFKGVWASKFDKAETRDEAFGDGGKQIPVMHKQEKLYNYAEDDLCQALRLPFGNEAYAMTILLPREGKSVGEVAEALTAGNWSKYQRMAGRAYADVKLPRFESQTDVHLEEVLAALGITDAFDGNKADFSGFCDQPTFIDLMKQVAKIKLDEDGAVAAAVTVVGEKNSANFETVPHVTFHAIRPFLYVISEQSTGAVFFVGQYCGD